MARITRRPIRGITRTERQRAATTTITLRTRAVAKSYLETIGLLRKNPPLKPTEQGKDISDPNRYAETIIDAIQKAKQTGGKKPNKTEPKGKR